MKNLMSQEYYNPPDAMIHTVDDDNPISVKANAGLVFKNHGIQYKRDDTMIWIPYQRIKWIEMKAPDTEEP